MYTTSIVIAPKNEPSRCWCWLRGTRSEETLWPQIERREDESGIALVEVHTNKLKFKAPATSSEPQIVLVSVNEGILSTNTFFFLDEELITNEDDDEGWGRGWIMIMMILNWYKFSLYLLMYWK